MTEDEPTKTPKTTKTRSGPRGRPWYQKTDEEWERRFAACCAREKAEREAEEANLTRFTVPESFLDPLMRRGQLLGNGE